MLEKFYQAHDVLKELAQTNIENEFVRIAFCVGILALAMGLLYINSKGGPTNSGGIR